MTAKERLTDWFNNPRTPEDAWKTWKLHEIAAAAEVSEHTVKVVLPVLVKDRYPTIGSYARFKRAREAYRRINRLPGAALPKADIEKIQELRRDGGDLISISIETGHSYRTVQKYCKGIKRGGKKRRVAGS